MAELFSYNRYLAVAARAVRRSLKDEPRVVAERRGIMVLRVAKWEVGIPLSKKPVRAKFQEAVTNRPWETERQAGRR